MSPATPEATETLTQASGSLRPGVGGAGPDQRVEARGAAVAVAQAVATNRISSALLFSTVALAPFPFGSTDPSSVAFWCVILGIGMLLASLRAMTWVQLAVMGSGLVILALYGIVLREQTAAEPWFTATRPHRLWEEAAEALGVTVEPSVSIARHQPLFAIGAPLAAMMALILSCLVCVDRRRARQLVNVIAWSGVAYALYGMLAYVLEPTRILWRLKEAYFGSLTSTFINRNTAAAYFGSCAVICLLLLCERIRETLPNDDDIKWWELPSHVLAILARPLLLKFSMLFICLAAMFMTGSRAGATISLLALIIAFFAFFYRKLTRSRRVLIAVAVAGALALLLLQVLGAGVSGRFDLQGLADGGRIETYRGTMRIIADHPWIGTGLGTFAWIYPSYRSSAVSLWGTWDRAHSSLLELAAEGGIPLAATVAMAWLLILAVLLRGVRTRRRDLMIPVAAFSVALLALLHSLVDFSLQITGYAVPVFALVGAGISQSFRGRPRDRHR
jgi:O-antigen ligase